MSAINKVPTQSFSAMCEQLATLAARPCPEVLKAEVTKVLSKTLKDTRQAKVDRILARYKDFVPMGMDSYSPKRIRRYANLRGSQIVYYRGNRYPAALWAALQARRAQLILTKRAARGLAKQSWLQLADKLGITLEGVPGNVATAKASTGRSYSNVTATETANQNGANITISNAQPTAVNTGGEGALRRAMAGREKYFKKSAELAVFGDMKKAARAYPGLKITVPA